MLKQGYIKITNKGEIDLDALMLLGATNKRNDDTKIGYFGSGLKYALAVLLRNHIPVRIFSGTKEIKVQAVPKQFRGQTFNVIKIGGKLTSLTTDMGPDWEAWFAVREIYCNAIDEGEYSMTTSGEVDGQIGTTSIYIGNDEKLSDLFKYWDKYFSNRRKDLIIENADLRTKIYEGSKSELIIYRKGVRAHKSSEKSLFHYDLGWVKINESRVLENIFDVSYALPKILGRIATVGMIKKIFDEYQNTFEGDLPWNLANAFNEEWLNIIGGRSLVIDNVAGYFAEELATQSCVILPEKLVEGLRNYFGNKINVLGRSDKYDSGFLIKTTAKQAQYLNDALQFLKKADVEIEYPIQVWHFKNESQLGEARDETIRVSPKIFDMGKREIVKVILEEYSHLHTGAMDKTRAFQEFLLNKWLGLLEDKINERL